MSRRLNLAASDSNSKDYDGERWVDSKHEVPIKVRKKRCTRFSFFFKFLVWFVITLVLFSILLIFLAQNKYGMVIWLLMIFTLFLLLLVLLLRFIFHISVFPGSFKIVRVPLEHSVSKQVAKVYAKRLHSFYQIIDALNKQKMLNAIDQKAVQEHIDEIKRMLEFLLWDPIKLNNNGLLKKDSLFNEIKTLRDSLKSVQIFVSTGSFLTLFDLEDYLDKMNCKLSSNNVSYRFYSLCLLMLSKFFRWLKSISVSRMSQIKPFY